MKISSLKIRNFRTLESIDLNFSSSYAAICGANDCGKTNVVRVIRALAKGDSSESFFRDEEKVSLKEDYTKWSEADAQKREITLDLCIAIDRKNDVGFYEFVLKQLEIQDAGDTLSISLLASYKSERSEPTVKVTVGQKEYDGLSAQEILKKLQSSRCILFHNSTGMQNTFIYSGDGSVGHIREITGQHVSLIESMKKTVARGLAKISKSQQSEFENLLGRLQAKYKVGLSLPAFDLGYMPYSITLGDRRFEVPLDDWGSGTKNRTLVLLALFRARQIRDSEASAAKITPIMIVEEPESFLHPSAQAEFGRVLQDLAEEFQIQVLVTTHSPYLLNLREPSSNILFRRRVVKHQLRDTERVDTSGDNWMAPFGQALGLEEQEFRPWKALILAQSDSLLLVEGDTDKEYFELLKDPAHGTNALRIDSSDIVPYGGTGSLGNNILLKFVKNRHPKFFVTFDLDAVEQTEKSLLSLQLEKGKHFLPIGQNSPGKKNIEGLLPDKVTTAVYAESPGLVQAATNGTKQERESARNNLKRRLLEEFKKQAKPTPEFYSGFYPVVRAINKALSS